MNRKVYSYIKSLTVKHNWLLDRSEELSDLFDKDCKNSAQQELIFDLLERFEYLSSRDFNFATQGIVSEIVDDPLFDQSNTIITATAMDSSVDSSQFVIYHMKCQFEKKGWSDAKLLSNLSKISKEIKKIDAVVNVVIVDEFIGSGATMKNKIAFITKQASELRIECKIRVYSVAASIVGYEYLKSINADVRCKYIVKRGITDHFGENSAEKISTMREIESILSSSYKNRPMPSLGYGQTESLYHREFGNSPNSVFPVFWWNRYKGEDKRKTILTRYMGDA